jgi:hypothetical protein
MGGVVVGAWDASQLCHRHGPWRVMGYSSEPGQSGGFAAHSQQSEKRRGQDGENENKMLHWN